MIADLLAAAFTEWDRRYREEPERFEAEAVRLLKGTPETYGEAAAPYLLAILAERGFELAGGAADQDTVRTVLALALDAMGVEGRHDRMAADLLTTLTATGCTVVRTTP